MLRSHVFVVTLACAGVFYEATSHPNSSTALANASPTGSVSPASPMLEPRSGHSATLLPNGKVLIAGGMRRNQDFYRSAELYDPATGKFQTTGSMAVARVGNAAVLLRSGKVLIVGGWVGHGSTDSAELYDPVTGQFTMAAKMTAVRGRPTATLLGSGDVLITGGSDHFSPGGVASAEIFCAADGKFEPVSPMHAARVAQTATVLKDGRVLIVGGRGDDSVTASAELYNPATKQFTVTGSMLTARCKHSAGLLPDGRVLIAGGSDDRGWHGKLDSAEIYDPGTGKFTAASPLHDSRFKLPDEAAQLASGELLFAGGSKTVELYDPATGKFLIAAGQMNDARHYMSETELKNGSVLLAGGYPDNDQATAETWIYHP
jgi:Kelch motif/Galactose oxidase, central domain